VLSQRAVQGEEAELTDPPESVVNQASA
jgi:hypothetical protein